MSNLCRMEEIAEHGPDWVITHEGVKYVLRTMSGGNTTEYKLYSEQEGNTSTLIQLSSNRVSVLDKQRVEEYTVIVDFAASEGLLIVDKCLYIQFDLRPSEEVHLILADITSKELLVVPRDASADSSVIISADRWEGPCEMDSPCGWGRSIIGGGVLAYEGFRVKNRDVCYGTYYRADGSSRYVGGLVNGRFWGPGDHFNAKGDLVYCGEWIWNRKRPSRAFIKSYYDPVVISQTVSSLTFGDNAGTSKHLTDIDFSPFQSLTHLTFQHGCFPHARRVRLCNLPELTTVDVGDTCFFNMRPNRSDEREFRLQNCPKLSELCIGALSFYTFTVCALAGRCGGGGARIDLPALQEIRMGKKEAMSHCFMYADLVVRGVDACRG